MMKRSSHTRGSQISRLSINKTVHNLQMILIVEIILQVADVCGHGRLIEPPSRSSAYRYGFGTPKNDNDHELYCGGLQHQIANGGKCGVCGDAWDLKEPRPNEHGGTYGRGVIVRKYNAGSDMEIRVELTASHKGYFEFRICQNLSSEQECFDQNLLTILKGAPSQPSLNDLKTRFYPRNGSRTYDITARLPAGLECGNCVLQWHYHAGNNWGRCKDGHEELGCGVQEEFRGCSDITIGKLAAAPPLQPKDDDTNNNTVHPIRPNHPWKFPNYSDHSNHSNHSNHPSQPNQPNKPNQPSHPINPKFPTHPIHPEMKPTPPPSYNTISTKPITPMNGSNRSSSTRYLGTISTVLSALLAIFYLNSQTSI